MTMINVTFALNQEALDGIDKRALLESKTREQIIREAITAALQEIDMPADFSFTLLEATNDDIRPQDENDKHVVARP